ncbi:MAG: putative succinyl-diaminopimelate desuccinylase DapE [Gemmatimonadaceae bacterium]|nr:putative succinyl-diaminopimelate desuccinylase DapE [Gemmatimonadaceae bacterium]
MQVESTSGREEEAVALMERLLVGRNWGVERIPVSEGRDALLATMSETIDVTLSTHLDTVPPYIPPSLDGAVLRGRGACDAKGIAASMICAADRLRARGMRVGLLFVVGEETTHDGALAANAHPNRSRVIVNGEPTENTLAIGTKGALRMLVRAHGKAAHSAYPHLGSSAIATLVERLAALPALELPVDPVLGETTVNIGSVSGGVADNVVSPWAEARLMVRLVSDADEALELFRTWAGTAVVVEKGVSVPAVRLGVLPGFPTSVAAYATDIPALSAWGTPYLYGPGSIHVAHTMDEYVRIADLERAVDDYERIAIAALALERARRDTGSA